MAEYIDRGDLTIWLNKKSCEFSMNDVAPIGWTLKGLVNELATFPSADVVERKNGKWCADYDYAEYDFDGSTPLPEPRKFQDGWKCSLCGGYSLSETNYCPNCGAEMIGGDEDEDV